jgi:transcription termination/antitermination protein NusG
MSEKPPDENAASQERPEEKSSEASPVVPDEQPGTEERPGTEEEPATEEQPSAEDVGAVDASGDVTDVEADATPEQEVAPPQEDGVGDGQVEVTEPQVEVTEPQVEVTEPEVEVTEPQVEVTEPEVEAAAPVEPARAPVPSEPVAEEPSEEPSDVVDEVEERVSGDGEPDDSAAAVAATADPFAGAGDWYVIHTYAGYENKVKANLESRINTMQMQDKIFDVVIPMEDVMEIKGGRKQVVQKKVFPGYLLVRMVYDDDSWYVVRNTPGVTGFVSSGTGQKPTPLSRREVEKILAVKKEEVKPTFRLDFEEGDVVRIISGPFADFNGTIDEINVDQSKVKVLVNIFDRETPVELSFDQVARV